MNKIIPGIIAGVLAAGCSTSLAADAPASPHIGVNYQTLFHAFQTPADVLERDFARFRRDGMTVLSIALYWYRVETARGTHDDALLARAKALIERAHRHGLQVIVTFHTLWGEGDSAWCTPAYVTDPVTGKRQGLAILRSTALRDDFIAAMTHATEKLRGTEGIGAWALLDEPWYWPPRLDSPFDKVDQRENAIVIIERLSAAVKRLDGRATTVCFVNMHSTGVNVFERDWQWDARLLKALDFISLNAYAQERPGQKGTFKDYLTVLGHNVDGCRKRGKTVWITEFGHTSANDDEQEAVVRRCVSAFREIGVSGWLGWVWQSEAGPASLRDNFNLCREWKDGQPRPGYWALLDGRQRSGQ